MEVFGERGKGRHFSWSAVFDDEGVLFVTGNGNYLNNPRGLVCVEWEKSPRNQIELFDDGAGGEGVSNTYIVYSLSV